MDYDFKARRTTGVYSLAGMFPLYFGISGKPDALREASLIYKQFLYPGGLITTVQLTHQQWDAPNGWAPLQWISYVALKNYGSNALADTIKNRWITIVEQEYQHSGKLLEKYNVVYPNIPGGGGEYPSQDGFGWTNGVFLKMKIDPSSPMF
jgi:alpha,alpha-trehalase